MLFYFLSFCAIAVFIFSAVQIVNLHCIVQFETKCVVCSAENQREVELSESREILTERMFCAVVDKLQDKLKYFKIVSEFKGLLNPILVYERRFNLKSY